MGRTGPYSASAVLDPAELRHGAVGREISAKDHGKMAGWSDRSRQCGDLLLLQVYDLRLYGVEWSLLPEPAVKGSCAAHRDQFLHLPGAVLCGGCVPGRSEVRKKSAESGAVYCSVPPVDRRPDRAVQYHRSGTDGPERNVGRFFRRCGAFHHRSREKDGPCQSLRIHCRHGVQCAAE